MINLCADILTRKEMTKLFLGVTAHCLPHADHKRHSFTLAVEVSLSPHSVAQIFDNFLQ